MINNDVNTQHYNKNEIFKGGMVGNSGLLLIFLKLLELSDLATGNLDGLASTWQQAACRGCFGSIKRDITGRNPSFTTADTTDCEAEKWIFISYFRTKKKGNFPNPLICAEVD